MMASQTAKSAMSSSTAADEHKKIENESKLAVVCKENEQSEKDAVIDYVHSLQEFFSKFGLYTDRGKDFEDLVKQLENPTAGKVFVEEQLALIRRFVLTPGCAKKEDINPNFLSEGSSDGRTRTFSSVPNEASSDFVGDSHEIIPGQENAENGEALSRARALADGASHFDLGQSSNPSAKAYSGDRLQLLPSREEVEDIKLRLSALEQSDKKRVEYLQLKATLDKMVICLKRCVKILLEKAKQCDEIPQIKRDLLAVQDCLEKVEASIETKKTAQDDGHLAGPMF